MSTEREREARDHRSRGRELAEGIEADADRQKPSSRQMHIAKRSGFGVRAMPSPQRSTQMLSIKTRNFIHSIDQYRRIKTHLQERRICWLSILSRISFVI